MEVVNKTNYGHGVPSGGESMVQQNFIPWVIIIPEICLVAQYVSNCKISVRDSVTVSSKGREKLVTWIKFSSNCSRAAIRFSL